MATAGDGKSPYGSGGAGGKFRKRPFRRSVPATPYDRPPTALKNNNPSLLTKLVDPASRLIYAGAHRLFGAFRKRLPPLSLQGPPVINEEAQNVPQGTEVSERSPDQGGNSASISAATGISELEQMLNQKTFTRSEIQHLTALLHSRTTESTSDSLRKHEDERDNFHAAITTPVICSRTLEGEVASPAEVAKASMGSRPMKAAPSALGFSSLAPRQDSKTPITSVVPKTANSFRGLENGYLTPRSRGRSAMYSMARTPYSRGPSAFSQKGIRSDYGHDAALTSSQSAWEQNGKMTLKRRNSVLDDDIGSGGPLRRTRQKPNLLDKKELGYTASQKLLLMNEPESKDAGMRDSGYASVPTKSTQMATKILQQLERLGPKEKSPAKLTLNMLHGPALRSLEKVDSSKYLPSPRESQNSEVQHHARLHDTHEPTSQSKVEGNGSRKFPIPRNMLTSVNGDSTVPLKDNMAIVAPTDSTSKLPVEPPQKKRAFQMTAPEDSWEVDDEIHVNGHVSFPLAENNKPDTSLVVNTPVLVEEVQTPKTHAQVEVTPVLREVTKIPEQAELKEAENATSSSKSDVEFLNGSVSEQGKGFTFSTSPPSTTTTQTGVLPQSTLQMDKISPEKDSNAISVFGTSAEKVAPIQFSANIPSEFKPNASSDPKTPDSTSVFSSFTKNDQVKFPMSDNDENGNDQKSENVFGKSESLFSSAIPAAPSTSGIFSFGSSATNSTTPNATPVSGPAIFSSSASFPTSGANMNSPLNNSSSHATSASTTTTSSSSSLFSTPVPAPVFSFGSATATTITTSMAETGNTNAANEKEPKSNITSSPFATATTTTTTTPTGSSLFGFNSPAAATSTTNNQSQISFFNVTGGSQANTQAVPFQFGSSSSSLASGSTSASSLFSSSAPAFGSSPSFGISVAASSETKSGNSTSGSTTSIFGSTAPAWQPQKPSGFGRTFSSPSPVFSFGASSTPTPSATSSPVVFGSSNTGVSSGSSVFSFATTGATNSSFANPSQGQSVFGNSTPVFGGSPNNNDQMSMEDTMAEDSMQAPSPVSPFGQTPAPVAAPGFMFGSATPTQTAQPAVPFQFGGQPNQAPVQNPFQSSSVEFNAGGSFSLGSGGDKSGRRMVRVKKTNRRKP